MQGKGKKRSPLLLVIITVALIGLILFEDPTQEEDKPLRPVKIEPSYRKNLKKKPKTDEATVAENTPKTEENSTDAPVEEVKKEDVPSSESTSVSEPETVNMPEEISVPEMVTSDSSTNLDEPTQSTENVPVSVSGDNSQTVSGDIIDTDLGQEKNENAITEDILKDLEEKVKQEEKKPATITEYVPPPAYEYYGRGLVYNCFGKHWACVDGPSYKICEDNSSSVKYLRKKTECYPFNVYESSSGCAKVQNQMVSSSAKTEFCGE